MYFHEFNSTIIFSAICSLIVYKIIFESLFSPLRHFPGPFLAKFTDLYRAFFAALGHIDRTNMVWHRKYGTTVRIGPNTISLDDISLVGTIYATKNAWRKSDMYSPSESVVQGQRIFNLFSTRDHELHDQHIKPIRNLWTMTKLLIIEPLIDETLRAFTTKLKEKFADGSDNPICAMDEWLAYFAWDEISNVTFGRPYGFLDQERDVDGLIDNSRQGLYYFAFTSQIPWIDKLLDKNPIIRTGPRVGTAAIDHASQMLIQYRQKSSTDQEPDKPKHFLARYLKMQEENPDLMDDNKLITYLMLNIVAAGDTTSASLRSIIYHLAKDPTAYEKLTLELDNARLALPAQWKGVRNLPYLDAVIRESMRINPGLAMILERVVPEGGLTLPDGRYIPVNTNLGINPAVTNRDYKIFGADADTFNPDRWLRREGENEEEFEIRHRQMVNVVDFGFGAGSRVCIGRYFAQLELWKTISTLYSTFDIKLVDPKHTWQYHNAWFVYQWDIPMMISPRTRS